MKKILIPSMALMSLGIINTDVNAMDENMKDAIKNTHDVNKKMNSMDWDKPFIYSEEIILEKGKEYNLKNYVIAFDYELNDLSRYIIVTKNNIDINKPGKYKVGFAVLDEKEYRRDIEVEVVVADEDFNFSKIYSANGEDKVWIEKGTEFNPLDYVWASEYSDNTWKSLSEHIIVTKNNVNPNEIGEYKAEYTVLDTKGNRVKREIDFEVYESIESESIIYAYDKYFPLGADISKEDLLKDIIATDYTNLDISSHIIISENNINSNKVGEYSVSYAVLDTKGEIIRKTVSVKIYKAESIIYGEDVRVKLGSSFNPLEYIDAVDSTGISLNSHIIVTKNNVNTTKQGIYEVDYLVLDTNNKRVTKTIYVIVE